MTMRRLPVTQGEAWWLRRRRLGLTQAVVASQLCVSEDTYRHWEADAVVPLPIGLPVLNDTVTRPLTYGEFCALARRRKGWTLPQACAYLDISRQTLIKIERDRTNPVRRVAEWWAVGVPPSRAGASALRLTTPVGFVYGRYPERPRIGPRGSWGRGRR
jgi:transcriptional regulator with XRE-family HTH domain